MAIPTDYIFQSGTCLKNQIYQLIIDKLIAAGWTNISSLASADFVVLKSAGNAGNKNLILNIRDTSSTNVNSVVSTDYCAMSYRLQDTYIPGTAGVAGTFGRPSLAWTNILLVPVLAPTTAFAAASPINYKVYADASKIILALEYPLSSGYGPVVIYIGQPDTVWVDESNSRGMVVAVSNNGSTAGSVTISNTSNDSAPVTAPYAMATTALLPVKNPNGAQKYPTSDIIYHSAAESFRGKLDGLLCLYNSNFVTGDLMVVDGKTYYALSCATQGITSFPSQGLLVRTS